MTTDIRAALERLTIMSANELDMPRQWAHSRATWDDAITAARAALAAEPVAAEPTYKELYDLADEYSGDVVPAMRAALARWGRPTTPPAPEVGELGELVLSLRETAARLDDDWYHASARIMRSAATLLQQLSAPAPVVVPVVPVIVRYEFEVLDEFDQTAASGDAATLEEAGREGRHYLRLYQQDGPCTLELRRVEVLSAHAIPLPSPATSPNND
jgi:hypothetical protein